MRYLTTLVILLFVSAPAILLAADYGATPDSVLSAFGLR